jgi:hypothetical protein
MRSSIPATRDDDVVLRLGAASLLVRATTSLVGTVHRLARGSR